MLTRIKICGLTNEEDAQAAAMLGADALGFITVPETPRYVTADEVRAAQKGLPPFVTPVIVARSPLEAVGYPAGTIQYYSGDTDTNNLRRIRVFRVRDEKSLDELREYRFVPDAVLLDTYHDSSLGGAGRTFDWTLALEAKRIIGDIPLILAGGLTPENVGEAIRAVRPYSVDVSSGVEARPRYKDHDKIRRFVEAVRKADAELSGE